MQGYLDLTFKILIKDISGFLGPVVKNPPANAGDTGSIPDSGKSHMWRDNKRVDHNS